MKWVAIKIRKRVFYGLISVVIILLFIILLHYPYYKDPFNKDTVSMVMGGRLYMQVSEEGNNIIVNTDRDAEKYFRPSELPVLNDRFTWRFFDSYSGKEESEIKIPDDLLKTPEDTILNYFSILREAANFQKGKGAGCGSVGFGLASYPVAYNFLSPAFQEELPYEQYLATFQNILHISLLKYRKIPVYYNPDRILRYFVELETIEGMEKYTASFAYYYGYVDLFNNNGRYEIVNLEFHGEDFLCAPYHGWSHDAEANVQIRYGGWCSMIKEMYPVIQKGYIKNISFKGTDGNDYLIVFFQLTNDTDIEIAQFMRVEGGSWQLIRLEPEKCLGE